MPNANKKKTVEKKKIIYYKTSEQNCSFYINIGKTRKLNYSIAF